MHWAVGKNENAGICGAFLPKIEEAEAGELLLKRASVFGDDFLGDGMSEVGQAETVFGEVGKRTVETGEGIERVSVRDTTPGKHAFFLLGSGSPSRADAEIHAPFVADRGEIGWEDFDHGHIPRR